MIEVVIRTSDHTETSIQVESCGGELIESRAVLPREDGLYSLNYGHQFSCREVLILLGEG